MFNCRVCLEKDKRIEDLRASFEAHRVSLEEQIKSLQLTLNPPPRIHKYELEESLVMDGGGQEIIPQEILEAEQAENERILRESDMIFAGIDEIPQ